MTTGIGMSRRVTNFQGEVGRGCHLLDDNGTRWRGTVGGCRENLSVEERASLRLFFVSHARDAHPLLRPLLTHRENRAGLWRAVGPARLRESRRAVLRLADRAPRVL